MDPASVVRLKKMSRAARSEEFSRLIFNPNLPRWEFENPSGEEELASRALQDDCQKQLEASK